MHRYELTHGLGVYYAAPTSIEAAAENPDTAEWIVDHPEKRYRRFTWKQPQENPLGKLVRITRDDREEYVPCSHLLGVYTQIYPIRAKIVREARELREQNARTLTAQLKERDDLIAQLATRDIIVSPATGGPTGIILTTTQLKDLLWRLP